MRIGIGGRYRRCGIWSFEGEIHRRSQWPDCRRIPSIGVNSPCNRTGSFANSLAKPRSDSQWAAPTSKQHFLNTVYERFFQGYSVKVVDTHGIV
jgi:hypothetical protein